MKNPTASDLLQSIPHLAFEFYYFDLFARRDFHICQNHGCHQAIGYAFLIHLRSLIEFFYSTSGRPDDLLAADFTMVFGRLALPQPPSDWNVEAVKKELGKRLAHLTAHRWQQRRPEMDFYERCVPAIFGLIKAFRDALPSELRSRLDEETSKLVELNGAQLVAEAH